MKERQKELQSVLLPLLNQHATPVIEAINELAKEDFMLARATLLFYLSALVVTFHAHETGEIPKFLNDLRYTTKEIGNTVEYSEIH